MDKEILKAICFFLSVFTWLFVFGIIIIIHYHVELSEKYYPAFSDIFADRTRIGFIIATLTYLLGAIISIIPALIVFSFLSKIFL